ncbi:MAG: pectate lyase precursor [Polyangiaceae bacterium]|nr:pectate lyase precursor [Polyangiaceae bacterium]
MIQGVVRPGSGRRRFAAALMLAGAAAACSSEGPRPRVGGETNWLSLCQSDADCVRLRCICGVCTDTCDDATRCHEGATCFAPGSPELAALCGDTEAPATCLATCDGATPCLAGFDCRDGVCRPRDVAAFPGAEGFAGRIRGGRGGRVLRVTSLAATGEGTLQGALDAPGARIIVFAVSGVIEAPLVTLSHGEVTIAGQTAPGGGITLRGRLFADPEAEVRDVVVRHLRVRPAYDDSDPLQFDAIQFSAAEDVLLDHVSAAFGIDDVVDFYGAKRVTVQWSTVESSLAVSLPEGDPAHGLVAGPDAGGISVHHCLFVHHQDDNPSIAGGPAEVIDNVVYDALHGFAHHDPASGPFDLVGNTFVAGPNSVLRPLYFDDTRAPADPDLAYYLADNQVEGAGSECGEGPLDDPWSQCAYDLGRDPSFLAGAPFDRTPWPGHVAVSIEAAAEARASVLARAGAFPRDLVTRGMIDDVGSLGGVWGAEPPDDLLLELSPGESPRDDDRDGMADEWEVEHRLDPQDPEDHNRVVASGYTAIEEYLGELAAALLPD